MMPTSDHVIFLAILLQLQQLRIRCQGFLKKKAHPVLKVGEGLLRIKQFENLCMHLLSANVLTHFIPHTVVFHLEKLDNAILCGHSHGIF